jgi:prolyl-tRNA synthetase
VEIENGEDTIYVCEKCRLAKNKEIFEDQAECTNCGPTQWRETKASEVGNIFKLQDKYSSAFHLQYTDQDGTKNPVLMGYKTVEWAVRALKGETPPKRVDSGYVWADKSNLDSPEVKAVIYE